MGRGFEVKRVTNFPFFPFNENEFNDLSFNDVSYNNGFDIVLPEEGGVVEFTIPEDGLYSFYLWLNPGGIPSGLYSQITVNGVGRGLTPAHNVPGQAVLSGQTALLTGDVVKVQFAPVALGDVTSILQIFSMAKVA